MNFKKINLSVLLSTTLLVSNIEVNAADHKPKGLWTTIKETMQYGPVSIRDIAPTVDVTGYERCHDAFLVTDKSGKVAARKLCLKASSKDRLEYVLSKHGDYYDKKHIFTTYGEDDTKSVVDMPVTTILSGREFPQDVKDELEALLKLGNK